jgi:hypothetical protein
MAQEVPWSRGSSGAIEAHDGKQVATISLAKYMTKKQRGKERIAQRRWVAGLSLSTCIIALLL